MLEQLKFNNRFFEQLPADEITSNYTRQVSGACYSSAVPIKVPAPKLIAFSEDAASLIDLTVADSELAEFTEVFSGNKLLKGMQPYATSYGGHQFGQWAGQLGDGRAINLGEVKNTNNQNWTLQLKGSGPTPYSRHADGFAVLRSSLREFLCSEAMHYLGIPTTRALSLILTGHDVKRDILYDGNPKMEPGAVVCRLSPSFTRFGHFQLYSQDNNKELLKQFTDFTIDNDFPEIASLRGTISDQALILKWFQTVCNQTCSMVVHWMRVGFVHGVLNTDNMSILSLTIDYGPYGWLEGFDGNWTPNTTDATHHRYAFGKQPEIVQWNLFQLANAIFPLIGEAEPLEEILQNYAERFKSQWQQMMMNKLGLAEFNAGDQVLLEQLMEVLAEVETDMSLFYRKLALIHNPEIRQSFLQSATNDNQQLATDFLDQSYYNPENRTSGYHAKLNTFLTQYLERCDQSGIDVLQIQTLMNQTNPKYVLRNYLTHEAAEKAENGDYSMLNDLLEMIKKPYDEQPEFDSYSQKRPEWARHKAGCSMLSCSS
jgi:uncharacterized protein YdiU (UPF0061 family)